jgi:hypothetical protein
VVERAREISAPALVPERVPGTRGSLDQEWRQHRTEKAQSQEDYDPRAGNPRVLRAVSTARARRGRRLGERRPGLRAQSPAATRRLSNGGRQGSVISVNSARKRGRPADVMACRLREL